MQMQIEKTSRQFSMSFEGIAFLLFSIFIFLIPLTFSPSPYVNFFYSKTIPLYLITIASLFFFIFKIFRDGRYKIPLHPIFLIFLFIPFWYLFTSFMAVNSKNAFMGTGIETDIASLVAILFLFTFLVSYFVRSRDKILLIYITFGCSYVLLATFHILRLFLGYNFLSFNIFLNITSNTVGKWNEVAIISGIAVLLSLLSIEFLKLSKGFKIFSYVMLALSVFLTSISNFAIVSERTFQISFFSLIGVFALVFFVYFLSSSYEQSRKMMDNEVDSGDLSLNTAPKKRQIPYASLIVLIISVIFTFGFNQIGSFMQNHFGVSSYEERPTWNWTAETSWNSIKQKPLTGFGPNNFGISWALNKPAEVNNTVVWSNDFISAVGYIPSTITTTGPIGFIAWMIFFGFLIFFGFKSLFVSYNDRFSHYLTVSSFLISLFLWIIAFIYIPTTVILILTFLFTGLFLGSLLREGIINEKTFIFEDSKEKTFVSIMVLVMLLVGSIFWANAIGQTFTASVYASKGATLFANASSEQGLLEAQDYYTRALRITTSDIYLRALTNINLTRAQVSLNDQTQTPDQLRAIFFAAYQNAYGAANDAVKYNNQDYRNYLVRGTVSESIVGLGVQSIVGSGIPDAYQDAKNNYNLASKLNPKNPLIPLLEARLQFNNKDNALAKQSIAKALKLKPNYSDAYLLLAQIQLSENDNKGAIDTLIAGGEAAPDPNLFYTLGTLVYNNTDYVGAVDSLEKAVILNPYFSNARYFLALSYYNLGRKEDAIIQLEQIKLLNPGNTEVDKLISTFKEGKAIPTPTPAPNLNASSTSQTPKQ